MKSNAISKVLLIAMVLFLKFNLEAHPDNSNFLY
jgi:hypothetical protein